MKRRETALGRRIRQAEERARLQKAWERLRRVSTKEEMALLRASLR